MKNTKKKVLVGALVVSLAAIISMGTIAWFSAQDKVENTFKIVSSEDEEHDPTFAVDVWEKVPGNDKEQSGHTYDELQPGDTCDKDVNVENTGNVAQYQRVTVTVTEGAAWRSMLSMEPSTTSVPDLDSIVVGLNTGFWKVTGTRYDPDADAFVYTLYGNSDVEPDAVNQVFTAVKIPDDVTKEIAQSFDGDFTVKIVADAVQSKNLGGGKEGYLAAVDAFNTVEKNS